MLGLLSKKLTCFFIKKNAIDETEREIYNYCFEILLSTLINLIAIIIIACITKTYLPSLLFICIFMVLRGSAGGYHANTHFRCFLILMFVYSVLILLITYLNNFYIFIIGIIFNVTAIIFYALIAPVEHVNNAMNKKKRKKLRIKTLILTFVIMLISTPLLVLDKINLLGFAMTYANISVAISCLCETIKNKFKETKNL